MSEDHNKTITPSVSISDETRPVVWKPEDANRFLTSAIYEAQRPLVDQLKNRPITSTWLAITIATICVAAFIIALLLTSQLEKTERRADAAYRAKDELVSEKALLQAKSTSLEERLNTTSEQLKVLRGSGEELNRVKNDMARFRRQNELLRSQISGLEMEKVALARQLEAVKAMTMDDEGSQDEASGTAPFDGKGEKSAPEAARAAITSLKDTATTELNNALPSETVPTEVRPSITVSTGDNETITKPVADLQPTAAFQTRPEAAVVPEPKETTVNAVSEPVPAPQGTAVPVQEPVKETPPAAAVEAATEPIAASEGAEPAAFEAVSEAYGESLAATESKNAAAVSDNAEPVAENAAAPKAAVEEKAPEQPAAETEEAAPAEAAEETHVATEDKTAGEDAPEGEYVTSDEVKAIEDEPAAQ